MSLQTFSREIAHIEHLVKNGAELTPALFDSIPLGIMGLLYLYSLDEYPHLKTRLPEMPPAEVQQQWTGSDGHTLMVQSCAFVKTMTNAFERITGGNLALSNVLDYGCGWGRISRLMLKYISTTNIWAIDPWDKSIELCQQHRVPVNLAISDYLPKSLPVGDVRFDLIFAFSVFTHLSEKCAGQVLKVLREYINNNGLLAITIRPPEYWTAIHSQYPAGKDSQAMIDTYNTEGFAFIPHNRAPIDGDITYGDASISLDYIRNKWRNWEICTTEVNLVDPYQVIVFMRPI